MWSYSIYGDCQWRQISVSFSRKQCGVWPVETYVRVGSDIFMLQSRFPSIPCDRPSEDGTFYDVPLNILRVLSSSRCSSTLPTPPGSRNDLHHGPGAASVEDFLQVTDQVPLPANEGRSMEAILCAPACSSQVDENDLRDYAVVTSETA